MKHNVYYDTGNGLAALVAAAIRLHLLPPDLLPSPERVAAFLRDHSRQKENGDVHLLGERRGEKVYWCGLGRSATVVVRTWRHFLQLYAQPQEDYFFYQVPPPRSPRWRKGMRLLEKRGAHEKARHFLAEAAVRDYPVFLTVLMTDWREG